MVRHLPAAAQSEPSGAAPVRDLADFLVQWGRFRPEVTRLQDNPALSRDEAEILGWLVALTDRLRAEDVL